MRRKKAKIERSKEGLKIPRDAKKCRTFDETGNELWEIENILKQRKVDGKTEYLVKWTNWPYRNCTWEPEESFLEDMGIILQFVKEKNAGKKLHFRYSDVEDYGPPKKKSTKKKSAISRSRSRPKAKETTTKAKKASKNRIVQDSRSKSRGRGRPRLRSRSRSVSRSRGRSRSKSIKVKGKTVSKSKPKSKKVGRKPKAKKESASESESKSEEESSDETKIVIQKLTVPATANVFQMEGTNTVIVSNNKDVMSPLGSTQKMTDVFFCRCTDDTSGGDSDEKQTKHGKKGANDLFDDNDSLQDMEVEEDDEEDSKDASELKSQRSDFSVPLMENELEKISENKVVVEECFTFAKSNLTQTSSFRFKVAFYDDDNNLKGYDYFSYDEIKQKKWENALLNFYAQELLTEMAQNGTGITPNIKMI